MCFNSLAGAAAIMQSDCSSQSSMAQIVQDAFSLCLTRSDRAELPRVEMRFAVVVGVIHRSIAVNRGRSPECVPNGDLTS